MGNQYGDARVSTKEQNEDRQMIAMGGVRVPRCNIYMDKQSGKNFDRPMSFYRKARYQSTATGPAGRF